MNYSKSAGITTETDYPYTAETGTCQPDKIKPVATIDGYVKLPTNDYDALMTAVATIGPIAISVSADWAFYLATCERKSIHTCARFLTPCMISWTRAWSSAACKLA